jgi:hypothetical protein
VYLVIADVKLLFLNIKKKFIIAIFLRNLDAENEKEKAALKKLENQALNAKYEMKKQYLELEIDTLRYFLTSFHRLINYIY